jgi:hypothetical protein
LLDQLAAPGRSVVKHCGTTGGQSRRLSDSWVAPSAFDVPYLSHRWLMIISAAQRHISAEEMAFVRSCGFRISGGCSDRNIRYDNDNQPLKRVERSRIEEDAI